MTSLFNLIVRRGHVPREASIRRLMEGVGLVVTSNSDVDCDALADAEADGDGDDFSDSACEGGESENDRTDDEELEGI